MILRVALQQAKLRREGAGGLAVGLVLRPQPRKVKVGVADGPHFGGGGTVVRLHQGLQGFTRLAVAFVPRLGRLLKIYNASIQLQPVGDLRGAQGVLRQLVQQHLQGAHIQPQLVSVLVPQADGAVTHAGTAALLLGIAQRTRQHGAGCTAALVGVIMPRIDLEEQIIFLAGHGVLRENIIGNIVVRYGDPVRTAGAEGLAVDKERRFAAHIKGHHEGLICGFCRDGDGAAHPHVFPSMTPFGAFGHGGEGTVGGSVEGEVLHGAEALEGDGDKGGIEVLGKHALPML